MTSPPVGRSSIHARISAATEWIARPYILFDRAACIVSNQIPFSSGAEASTHQFTDPPETLPRSGGLVGTNPTALAQH